MRRVTRSLLLCLAIMLVSCSDDGDPAAPEPTPTTQATKTIPPTGGSIRVQNAAGVALQVTLPSGAVLAPTPVTLRAVAAPSGAQARFEVEPAGLDLLEPATITITIPDGMAIDETSGLSFVSGETIRVPTDVDKNARTLRASLYHLGFDLPVPGAALASSSDGSEFIDVDAMNCQLMFESLTDAILRAQAFSSPFPPDLASPLILQYRAMLVGCPQSGSLEDVTAALSQYACSNASSAEGQAGALPVTSVADFKRNLGNLLAAKALIQSTGANCEVDDDVVGSQFTQYIDSYVARINDPGFTASFDDWDTLWREIIPVTELLALASEFELSSASERITDELFPALFARLREVAGEACEEDQNSGFLADILTGGHVLNHAIGAVPQMPPYTGFTQAEVLEQYHRCGSSLSFEARSPQGDLIDSITIEGGTQATITVIKDGQIAIEDNLLGLMCGNALARDEVRLFAEIPNTLPTAALGTFSDDRTLDVASVLDALPGDEPVDFDLVFTRDRSQCAIDNGGVPTIELYRTHVRVLGGAGTGTGTWGGCTSASGTFECTIDNDGHVTGTYAGTHSGTITGTVNGAGTFEATASGTAGGCTWQGTISGFGANLRGSGSFDCGTCGGGWAFDAPN